MPHSCLLSSPNQPSSPSTSSRGKCSSPHCLGGSLLSSLQLMYIFSVLCWGAQNQTHYPGCGLTSAESRGITPSLDQTVQSMQPRVLLTTKAYHWLMHSTLTAACQNSQGLSCRPAPWSVHPQPVSEPQTLHSQVQDLAVVPIEFHELPLSPFLQPLWVPTMTTALYLSMKLAQKTSTAVCPSTL